MDKYDIINDLIQSNDIEKIKVLLSEDSSYASASSGGYYPTSALLNAVDNENLEIVQLLIEYGANLESKDTWGRTALIDSAMKANLELVKLLLDAGANKNAQDYDGVTALSAAMSKEYSEIIDALQNAGSKVSAEEKRFKKLLRKRKATITVLKIPQFYNLLLRHFLHIVKSNDSITDANNAISLICPQCKINYKDNTFDVGYFSTIANQNNIIGLTGMYGKCKSGLCPNPSCNSKKVKIELSI